MSSSKNTEVSEAVRSKVFAIWPWLEESGVVLSSQDCDSFYSYTYGFNGDDWGDRLSESADTDESLRTVLVYKVCLENGFNGEGGKPSLSSVWKDIHTLVVCPLFKKGKAAKLNSSYIDYFVSQHDLKEEEVKGIWKEVYRGPDNPEYEWAFSHFYNWIQDDRRHWSSVATKPQEVQSTRSNKGNMSVEQGKDEASIERVSGSSKRVVKTKKVASSQKVELPDSSPVVSLDKSKDVVASDPIVAKKVSIKNKKFFLAKK